MIQDTMLQQQQQQQDDDDDDDDSLFWDAAVQELLATGGGTPSAGICTIPLPPTPRWWSSIAQTAFCATRNVLKCLDDDDEQQRNENTSDHHDHDNCHHVSSSTTFSCRRRSGFKIIANHADSAHVTGYHPPAAAANVAATSDKNNNRSNKNNNNNNNNNNKSLSSRYNAHRRGFVFSDCATIHVDDIFNSNIVVSHKDKSSNNDGSVDILGQHSRAAAAAHAHAAHAHDCQHSSAAKNTATAAADTATAAWTRLYQEVLHNGILVNMLLALERKLQLPVNYFQQHLGPTISNSQWHVKEYITTPSTTTSVPSGTTNSQNDDQSDSVLVEELLPTHTDPSILSVIVHDPSEHGGGGGGGVGAQGLQYAVYNPQLKSTTWQDVVDLVPTTAVADATAAAAPFFAVVLVGSVLSILTGGRIPACRHRVIQHHPPAATSTSITTNCTTTTTISITRTRMAATLFGRPAPTARLQLLPLHSLDLLDEAAAIFQTNVVINSRPPPNKEQQQCRTSKQQQQQQQQKVLTFEAWNQKVARNYEKAKAKK
jgi:hypothetical protein